MTSHIICALFFLSSNELLHIIAYMEQFMIYISLLLAFVSLFVGLYACGRVAKVLNATKELDWDAIANITGDLATTKKTIQTLNNRINGMHSPKIAEQELMMQLMQNQQNKSNGRMQGG